MNSYMFSWLLHSSLLQVHPGQGETEKVCVPFPEYQQSSAEVKSGSEWIKGNKFFRKICDCVKYFGHFQLNVQKTGESREKLRLVTFVNLVKAVRLVKIMN